MHLKLNYEISDTTINANHLAIFNQTKSESNSTILLRVEIDELEKLCGFNIQKQNVLFRASMHGYEAAEFHARCDFTPNTLTLIQTDLGYVFGGFTTQTWDHYQPQTDENSFIFSFRNKDNAPEKLLVNPVKMVGAINCHPEFLI